MRKRKGTRGSKQIKLSFQKWKLPSPCDYSSLMLGWRNAKTTSPSLCSVCWRSSHSLPATNTHNAIKLGMGTATATLATSSKLLRAALLHTFGCSCWIRWLSSFVRIRQGRICLVKCYLVRIHTRWKAHVKSESEWMRRQTSCIHSLSMFLPILLTCTTGLENLILFTTVWWKDMVQSCNLTHWHWPISLFRTNS